MVVSATWLLVQDMAKFMNRVNEGLNQEVPDGDQDALMACMTHVRDVRKNMTRTHRSIQPLRDTVALVKRYGIQFKHDVIPHHADKTGTTPQDQGIVEMPALDYLDNAGYFWDDTINKMFKRKEIIQSLQNRMADEIRDGISAFQDRLATFAEELYMKAPFQYTGKPEDAYRKIDAYQASMQLRVLERAALRCFGARAAWRVTGLEAR